MKQGSDYFYAKLLEDQFLFAQNMNLKSEWKYFKVIDSWIKKKKLPIYQDMALHKVVSDLHGISVPKSTVSVWMDRIPELLGDDELLGELLSVKEVVKKDEPKYTYEEWCYIHRLEGEKLNTEYKAIMEKLKNPLLPDEQVMKLTWASRRLMNKINKYGMTQQEVFSEEWLIDINQQMMVAGKKKLLSAIDKLPENMSAQSMKAVSWVINESFVQNRLLQNESTDNVAVGLGDIYDKILAKSEKKQISESVQDWEVEKSED